MGTSIATLISRSVAKVQAIAQYAWTGVWHDTRRTFWVRVLKSLNFTVRSFMDTDLQRKSMALTYSTVLAIVPAFALLFAIGRGFGFQRLLSEQLFTYFPAQRKAIEMALGFVDSYLAEASQGIFVGVGIVMLLWTLISLLSSIEDTFNSIWNVKHSRSWFQKINDYISICLLVPVLMVCSSGLSIFMSTTMQDRMHLKFLSPLIDVGLDAAPFFLLWMAFTFSFQLMPNTKVKLKYAAVAGIVSAVAFQILQLLFVNGQIYVSKYNAIYGSFAFLPLLLIWLQLSWLILLAGCGLTYSLQNVFSYNFQGDMGQVSCDYKGKVTLAVCAIIFHRMAEGGKPYTAAHISSLYEIPIRLTREIIGNLRDAGIIYEVVGADDELAVAPAVEIDKFTVGELFARVDKLGNADFIPGFAERYAAVVSEADKLRDASVELGGKELVMDMPIPAPPVPQPAATEPSEA